MFSLGPLQGVLGLGLGRPGRKRIVIQRGYNHLDGSYGIHLWRRSLNVIPSLEEIDQAVATIRERTSLEPQIGLVLGSGLGELAEMITHPEVIPFQEIPQWPRSTVEGHAGRLVVGSLVGQAVMIMQGRVHYYEGYTMSQVTFPIRVMQRAGVRTLILTNAAGGVNPSFDAGDVMLITDHINFPGMAGMNPLRGPNLEVLGERFPDMGGAYDAGLNDGVRRVAKDQGIPLREGVYAFLAGPSFETPAELRFLREAGADAVGMSTVPEVIVARHGGMRVLGLSGISNRANLDGKNPASHEEVLRAMAAMAPKMEALLNGLLRLL